jgi:hypothetical protein
MARLAAGRFHRYEFIPTTPRKIYGRVCNKHSLLHTALPTENSTHSGTILSQYSYGTLNNTTTLVCFITAVGLDKNMQSQPTKNHQNKS